MSEEDPVPEAEVDERPRARRRRWVWRSLALLLVIVAGAVLVLNSQVGKRFVVDRIAEVAPASGLRVGIGRIEGNLYGSATLYDVVLSDPKGPFLTVPEVDLDWRPLSWFSSGLDVRTLVAREGKLTRVPELLPGDPDAPILPDFDIRIDRFAIEDLTVAAGVIDGAAHEVNLDSRVDIRAGRALVKANGRLGDQDTLALLLDAEPDRDRFDIDLDYRAPRGGVVAGLIGAEAGYRARILGDGRWSAWNGALVARRDDAPLAAFQISNRSGQYRIAGEAYPQDLLEGLLAQAVGQKVSLLANGTLEDSVLEGSFAMRTGALDAAGKGAVDLAGNAFDGLAIAASLRQPELFGPDLRLENVRLAGTVDGPFRELEIRHVLNASRLAFGTTTIAPVTQQGIARYDGVRWTFPLDASFGAVETGNALADPRLRNGTLKATLVLQGNDLRSDDIALNLPTAQARLALRGKLDSAAFGLAGGVAANGLVFDDLGTVNAGARIAFRTAAGVPWTLDANVDGRVVRVSNATVANLAGPTIAFKGGVSLGAARPVNFSRLTIDSARLDAVLDGRVEGGRTVLAGSGRQADYGPFTVEATLDGEGPRATLVLADPLPAAGLRDVRLAIAPEGDGLSIVTSGQSLLGPFDGSGLLTMPQGAPARLAIRQLEVWRTDVTGELVFGDGGPSGQLALAGGGIDGTIGLSPRAGGQAIAVNLRAANASFGGTTAVSVRRARIEGNGLLAEGRTTFAGNAYAEGVTVGTLFLGRLAAQANIDNGTGQVTAALSGRRGSRFDLQLNAAIAPQRVSVAARGEYGGRAIRMPRRAVLLREGDGGWQLQRTQLNLGSGIVLAEGTFGGGSTALDLQLARMPLAVLDGVVPDLGLGGTVSGLVDYRSTASGPPTGSARVKVTGLTRSGLVLTSRPTDMALVARLGPDRLDARASVSEGGERRGRVQARITGLPRSGGLGQRLRVGTLVAQLRYSGPADAIWRLAAVDAFDFTGPLSVAANVTGSIADPRVRGSLASDDLRVRSGLSGTDIRNAKVRGTFSGSRLRLTRFSGTTNGSGTIAGSGTVDLSDLGARGPGLDIRVAASNARLLDSAGLGATVTGPLRIVSDGINGTIAGRVRVDRANWRLGQAASAEDLPRIRTREINLPADVAPRRAAAGQWRYLIDAQAPGRVEVDGLGLDSEWSANVRLRGTTSDPRIGGQAQLVRGEYTFAGSQFELTRGRIAFDENVPVDPRLDILAETERDGTEFQVKVGGRAQQPEITFSSSPALPEEEILAQLLFGGSINELSATDALQLGAAVASLRGGSGIDPINRLRTAIGLDRLRIVSGDPATGRGTGIALGENIGRRVYVEIITDGRGYTATEVEYRVTSWLSLLGAISTLGRESVSAEISRDY
ncbi:MAG: DUF490 domain-containing protein [Erythrobacter sp. 34-65-8]|nr:MAG: DUF490 domain-containing protein [Erythrobacter sp. 34-65-8]